MRELRNDDLTFDYLYHNVVYMNPCFKVILALYDLLTREKFVQAGSKMQHESHAEKLGAGQKNGKRKLF